MDRRGDRVKRLFLIGLVVCLACTAAASKPITKVIYGRVKGLPGGMQHEIELNIVQYRDVQIKDISLKYVQENMFGEENLLAVEGRVRNKMNAVLAKAVVTVDFLDTQGNPMVSSAGSVLPRIINTKGPAEGHFTVTTKYDPEITGCWVDVTWSGKRPSR